MGTTNNKKQLCKKKAPEEQILLRPKTGQLTQEKKIKCQKQQKQAAKSENMRESWPTAGSSSFELVASLEDEDMGKAWVISSGMLGSMGSRL